MPEAAQEDDLLARQRRWMNKMRWPLMLAATLAVSTTFRAGLNAAGRPQMVASSYAYMFNTMAFAISLLLVLLLGSDRFCQTWEGATSLMLIALLDLACLVAAFVFATTTPLA